jgi:hypothetical protein
MKRVHREPRNIANARRLAMAAAVTVSAAGCSAGSARVVLAGPDAPCAPAPGQVTTYDSHTADWGPLDEKTGRERNWNGALLADPPPHTDEYLRQWSVIAVIQVVSRAKPRLGSGADGDWAVFRPARVEVQKSVKGHPPTCVDIDVPGGVADGQRKETNADFAHQLDPGDRFVGLFAPGANGLQLWQLIAVEPDGTARMPYPYGNDLPPVGTGPSGGMVPGPLEKRSIINVDTWTLSEEALQPPPDLTPSAPDLAPTTTAQPSTSGSTTTAPSSWRSTPHTPLSTTPPRETAP